MAKVRSQVALDTVNAILAKLGEQLGDQAWKAKAAVIKTAARGYSVKELASLRILGYKGDEESVKRLQDTLNSFGYPNVKAKLFKCEGRGSTWLVPGFIVPYEEASK